jgi:hypothetical protein
MEKKGTVDLVEAYFDQGMKAEVPERRLTAVAAAMPFVREKFETYEAYARASVQEIYGDRLKAMSFVEVNTLESMIFLNRGDHFEAMPLPREAQFAPAFALCVGDYDGDGREDLFLSQNFFPMNPDTARNDGGRGLWLRGDGRGGFSAVPGQESGVTVYGDQRGSALCDYDADGRLDLVVTQNAADTKLFHNVGGKPGLRVRLKGGPLNPTAIGATLRLAFGNTEGPVREIHAGAGYWSQDSSVQVMGTPTAPTHIWIRWPGGKTLTSAIPLNAREIELQENGQLRVLQSAQAK